MRVISSSSVWKQSFPTLELLYRRKRWPYANWTVGEETVTRSLLTVFSQLQKLIHFTNRGRAASLRGRHRLSDNTVMHRVMTKLVAIFCWRSFSAKQKIKISRCRVSDQVKTSTTSCHHFLWRVIRSEQPSTAQWPVPQVWSRFWRECCHHGQALTWSVEAERAERSWNKPTLAWLEAKQQHSVSHVQHCLKGCN